MSEPNGNGNGKSLWTAAGVCSGVVLAIMGVVERGYARDREELREQIRTLESARIEAADNRGRINQTLVQLLELSERNRERILEVASESVRLDRQQDEALQREMRDEDETVMVAVDAVDRRLQGEMQTHVGVLNERISLLEAALRQSAGAYWTREDQSEFEGQSGLKLKPEGL